MKWATHDGFFVYIRDDVGYAIRPRGGWRAYLLDPEGEHFDTELGPVRKTLRAAVNDCKRHARKLRAALVEFNDIGVPEIAHRRRAAA